MTAFMNAVLGPKPWRMVTRTVEARNPKNLQLRELGVRPSEHSQL